MDQSKNPQGPTEMSAQAPAVYYQPQGPPPPPGYYGGPPGTQPYIAMQPQQPTVVVMAAPPSRSFASHMVLACCTFWCCGGLWGLIAFIVALIAHTSSAQNPNTANRLGCISVALSVIGIICGIIIIIYYVVFYAVAVKSIVDEFENARRNFTLTFTDSEGKMNLTAARNTSRADGTFF